MDIYNIETTIPEAFASIINSIKLIKDLEGNVFWPDQNYNQIEKFKPGHGYEISMYSNSILVYLDLSE